MFLVTNFYWLFDMIRVVALHVGGAAKHHPEGPRHLIGRISPQRRMADPDP